jgi:cyclin B
MLIACKYEEIYAPEVNDFVYISDKAYTREQILAMESIVLNTLKFNLTTSSVHRFAERYIKVAVAQSNAPKDPEQFAQLVHFLTELSMQDYKLLKYLPSTMAASAVYLALRILECQPWSSLLQRHTQYTETAIKPCVRDLHANLTNSNPKYKAVRKKYSSKKKYGAVATIAIPQMFL